MKRSLLVLTASLGIPLALVLGFVACDVTDRTDGTPNAVARVVDGEVEGLVDEPRREAFIREGLARINPGVRLAALQGPPTVEQIGPAYFLVGRGSAEDGTCVTVALTLGTDEAGLLGRLNEDGTFNRTPGGHTCTGVRCSGCELKFDSDRGAHYCNC